MTKKIDIIYTDPHDMEQLEDPFEMGLDVDGDWKGLSESCDVGSVWIPWWANDE